MSARTRSWLGAVAIAVAAIAVRVWLNDRDSDSAWARVREGAATLPPLPVGEQPHGPLLGASRSGEAAASYLAAIESGPKNHNDASESDEAWQTARASRAAVRSTASRSTVACRSSDRVSCAAAVATPLRR